MRQWVPVGSVRDGTLVPSRDILYKGPNAGVRSVRVDPDA